MLENLKNKTVILASQSARRQELLKMIDVQFKVEYIPDLNEDYPKELDITEIPLFIAKQKQEAYKHLWSVEKNIVITADTIVSLKNKIIGKPTDKNEARKILKQLSDKTHLVVSGVSIKSNNKTSEFYSTTFVSFKPLSKKIIDYYVENFNTLDKAGAYGIQDWIGFTSINYIIGSYYNVMGLPIDKVFDNLKNF
ncbi:MAG: Maf family nucleotide pyrophosphatase [Marinilabiliaceae bacterium]|nr:Maf family nucleotide pyrophosphatase [Marinilabiliaceae bacterium]